MTTDYRTETIQTAWEVVEEHIDEARLIAWDTCHKIYLALDDIEAEWFRENYDCVVEGSTDLMMKTLRTWYAESCPLKFIQGVRHNADNPNDGFISLIDQGAQDENDRCEECGYFDCDGHDK